MTGKVELHPAFVWDCESCERENFCRGVVPEMSPKELEELREDHGIEATDMGCFMMQPTSVECSACGAEFETVHYSDS